MNFDQFGQLVISSNELVDELYRNPNLVVDNFSVTDPIEYNNAVKGMHLSWPELRSYNYEMIARDIVSLTTDQFDESQQSTWYMPDEYKTLDIAQYILDLCVSGPELQRVGEELLLFQERDLFNLLRYLKYFVDTMRKNNVVWGLGRGSSTASYVLYLLGVHKINSLFYDLPIEEFLK